MLGSLPLSPRGYSALWSWWRWWRFQRFFKSPQTFPPPRNSLFFVCLLLYFVVVVIFLSLCQLKWSHFLHHPPPPPSQFPLLLKSNMAASADLSSLISARPDDIVYLFIYSLTYSLLLLCRCDQCKLCYHFQCLDPPIKVSPVLKGPCHEDIAFLGQFCAEVITLCL